MLGFGVIINEGRRKREEGRRKKEEGRRNGEGRRKKEEKSLYNQGFIHWYLTYNYGGLLRKFCPFLIKFFRYPLYLKIKNNKSKIISSDLKT
jgi:hypothetical protein